MLATIAMRWTTNPATYPFGPDSDRGAILSSLGGVPASAGSVGALVVGTAGTLVAIALLRRSAGGSGSTPETRRAPIGLIAAAWALAAVLLLVVPDYRVLVFVAYTPLFLVGLPFGLISVSDYVTAISPQIVAQAFAIAGGLAWTVVALERTRLFERADAAERWGRRATAVAVAIPLVYAATRWAWALGIPLGITPELQRFGQETRLWIAGAALATLALCGALLTLGLAMRWGERFTRWMPRLGGRPVPVALAVVPATIVAALVTSAGLMYVRLLIAGTLEEAFSPLRGIQGSWAALAPELLWPVWGLALAVAAYAYKRRREAASRRPSRRSDDAGMVR